MNIARDDSTLQRLFFVEEMEQALDLEEPQSKTDDSMNENIDLNAKLKSKESVSVSVLAVTPRMPQPWCDAPRVQIKVGHISEGHDVLAEDHLEHSFKNLTKTELVRRLIFLEMV